MYFNQMKVCEKVPTSEAQKGDTGYSECVGLT